MNTLKERIHVEAGVKIKTKICFALFPVKLRCGDWIWLEKYQNHFVMTKKGWKTLAKNRII